jgi:Ser-tRNA(Ala) deacylase AlaX
VQALNGEMARLVAGDEVTRVLGVGAGDHGALEEAGVPPAEVAAAGYAAHDTVRVVCVGAASNGCMCGGTHVPSTAVLGAVTVTKVKVKKGTTKISYQVQGIGNGK